MKKFTRNAALVAMMTLMSATANAQYITKAPDGGFDVTKGKDYVVLYAPKSVETKMGDKIIQNQNLDPDMKLNQFYYWTHNWSGADTKELQLSNVNEPDGKNSWGGSFTSKADGYLNITALDYWGGGGFAGKSQAYDLSKVTNDHILHIGIRDFGVNGVDAKGNPLTAKFKFQVGPLEYISDNGFQLVVNVPVGDGVGEFAGVGSVGHDKEWYYIDIPVKDLVESDNFGFEYDFSKPFYDKNNKPDHAFTVAFIDATESQATHELANPDDEVYTYTVTSLGTAISIDAVFFYKKDDSSTGIKDVKSATENSQVEAIYDLTGRQINDYRSGVNIVKTANGVKKVIKK